MRVLIKEIEIPFELESIFAYVYQKGSYAFWLDGNGAISKFSRFSFMGANPSFIFRVKQGKVKIEYPTYTQYVVENPFDGIQRLLDCYAISADFHPEIPFIAGFVGYFGYEMLRYIEQVPINLYDPTQAPQSCWMFFDQVLIFDHLQQKVYLSRYLIDDLRGKDAEDDMIEHIEEIKKAVQHQLSSCHLFEVDSQINSFLFQQRETEESYIIKIKKILEYISIGDIYQACLTHQICASLAIDPFVLYRFLRRINPAPFSSFLQMDDITILSSSPERFLKLDLTRRLESRPIKGTRPRGEDYQADQKMMNDLKWSIKDRAENVMIVDLVRNDLGRVSILGGVNVPQLFQIESYATVHQLVSTITSQLHPNCSPMDVLKATFPGGSMTGAPKIRALEILHSLETISRGIYSGGLGYLDVRGSFDLSMVIRTLIHTKDKIFFHVGGGIVADSDPQQEYQETMDKAFALKKTIMMAAKYS
jgi:para-aminobenzoate synthetase component I